MLKVSYLDGLSKAALPQHLSMDEVRWAEDAVRLIGHDTEWLWSIDVLPLGDGGRCVAGAWWLINAVAPPGGWEGRREVWQEEKEEKERGKREMKEDGRDVNEGSEVFDYYLLLK